jgi:hypothetical protein
MLRRVIAGGLCAALCCGGCWGDDVPALDQIGVVRTADGDVEILFRRCLGETVNGVALYATDDRHERITGLLWNVEATDGSTLGAFRVGRTPAGFNEITPLDNALSDQDRVQAVVTSSDQGPISMSLTVGNVRREDVLVERSRHVGRDEFDRRALDACGS